MQYRRLAQASIASAALAGVLVLIGAPIARGFSLLGGSLSLKQRDFRVFNNFTDPEANDNTATDPSFPGAVGAPLAIWKGCVEWGSEPHGDGFGDPEQPGTLGSGGANFDPSWQGLATSVGGPDDNVISQISGDGAGVLAFTELPLDDGWRIRFYADAAVWQDGPTPFATVPNHRDIQGVAAHEYGHALGLGHSGQINATMLGFANGTMLQARTIDTDDINGVRFLYGTRSSAKPRIASYSLSGNELTLIGENFMGCCNEVWFTNLAPDADGTPLKVEGLTATDGKTKIKVAIPAFAGPGDVLVKIAGSEAASLSNAFPFDPLQEPCPRPIVYGTAKTTSQGGVPALAINGRASLAVDDCEIGVANGIPNAHGWLMSAAAPGDMPYAGGRLYLARPVKRQQRIRFDEFGELYIPLPVDPALIGRSRCYQIWFEDPADPFGVGLTNAVQVWFCP